MKISLTLFFILLQLALKSQTNEKLYCFRVMNQETGSTLDSFLYEIEDFNKQKIRSFSENTPNIMYQGEIGSSVIVTIKKKGYLLMTQAYKLTKSENLIQVYLTEKGINIKGTVINMSSHKPMKNITIKLYNSKNNTSKYFQTDAKGDFNFYTSKNSSYQLIVINLFQNETMVKKFKTGSSSEGLYTFNIEFNNEMEEGYLAWKKKNEKRPKFLKDKYPTLVESSLLRMYDDYNEEYLYTKLLEKETKKTP